MADPTLLYCVGATKAGTSWLYSALYEHPECWLRAVKETHYFDTMDAADADRQVGQLVKRLEVFGKNLERARAIGSAARIVGLEDQIASLRDLIAVLSGDRTGDRAYLAWMLQGRTDEPLIADLTPSYALLSETEYARMLELDLDALVIYLVRDPVARLWSQVRMQVMRREGDADKFERRCNNLLARVLKGETDPGIAARGDYAGVIPKLRRVVPDKRLLIAYAETMFTASGWADICGFLGITATDVIVERTVLKGDPAEIDPDLEAQSVVFLREQYDFMARNMGPLPLAWQSNLAKAA